MFKLHIPLPKKKKEYKIIKEKVQICLYQGGGFQDLKRKIRVSTCNRVQNHRMINPHYCFLHSSSSKGNVTFIFGFFNEIF